MEAAVLRCNIWDQLFAGGVGDVPVPGVTPFGGVEAAPVLPEPGVGPDGAIAGGGTPGCGEEPLPG